MKLHIQWRDISPTKESSHNSRMVFIRYCIEFYGMFDACDGFSFEESIRKI